MVETITIIKAKWLKRQQTTNQSEMVKRHNNQSEMVKTTTNNQPKRNDKNDNNKQSIKSGAYVYIYVCI